MLFARAITPVLLVSILFLASCVEDKDYGDANTLRPEVNTNQPVNEKPSEDSTQKLRTLLEIPVEPDESDYRIDDLTPKTEPNDRVPGPKDYMLTVVLTYNDETASDLMEVIEKSKQSFDTEIGAETWFPAELKARADAEGDQKIKGKAYSAEAFAKGSYKTGTVMRVPQTNFFVIRMTSN